jgi:hypothetical protein
MQEATEALGLLGPVRVANYTRTFAPPKVDPHQQYRDRYMYGLPAYSPYLYWGCGYPYCNYPYFGFYPCYGPGSWITPTGIFYGD